MEKKKNKKSSNAMPNKTTMVIVTASLMCALLCVATLKILNLDKSYKIDSRVQRTKEYQLKHDDLIVSGWLKVQGTNIDYPILKNGDEIQYADDSIQYLWENGNMDKLNRVNYVLGHNIMNLSSNPLITEESHVRFEQLLSFAHYEFAKENQYIQFTVDEHDYLFKIFSISFPYASETSALNGDLYSEEDVERLIKKAKKDSVFDYDIDVNKNDKIITLSTCTRMFGSSPRNFQVTGRLVREGESTATYKVTKKDSYKEIEKLMKGADATDEA